MEIRESVASDKMSIRKVHLDAFDESERETVSQLAIAILEDETALPLLSLVVERDGEIIGNIIFSSVTIKGVEDLSAFILAPLAVATVVQKSGIGTQLIEKGLETLRERGAKMVFVYGDPDYYRRTGFKAGHNFKAPHQLAYPEGWLAQDLVDGIFTKAQGLVVCASALDEPELW